MHPTDGDPAGIGDPDHRDGRWAGHRGAIAERWCEAPADDLPGASARARVVARGGDLDRVRDAVDRHRDRLGDRAARDPMLDAEAQHATVRVEGAGPPLVGGDPEDALDRPGVRSDARVLAGARIHARARVFGVARVGGSGVQRARVDRVRAGVAARAEALAEGPVGTADTRARIPGGRRRPSSRPACIRCRLRNPRRPAPARERARRGTMGSEWERR